MKAGFAAVLLLLFSNTVPAEPDYLPIEPPQLVQSNKIELVEFFYYGCHQCYDLEPFLEDWTERHPEVQVVRIPAFKRAWLPLARTFYSLKILGQEKRLRGLIFSAIHDQGTDLDDEGILFDWLGKQGVDVKQFKTLYFSDEVNRRIGDSADLARRLGIAGVPSLVVDGKYLVLGNLARGGLLDRLVAKAKRARAP